MKKLLDEKLLFIISLILFIIKFLFPSMKILFYLFLILWIISIIFVKSKYYKVFIILFILIDFISMFIFNGYNDLFLRYKMIKDCYEPNPEEYIDVKSLDNNTYTYHILLNKKVTFIMIKNHNLYINGKSFGKNINNITKLSEKHFLVECELQNDEYNKIGYIINNFGFVVKTAKYDETLPQYYLDMYKK